MAQVTVDGICIAYDNLGAGEPALLFLPGWCSGRSVFRELLPRCSAQRRTLALDWRGHGDSGPAPSNFGADALVADALAVIDASGARQVVPVALSHAGWVAIELRRQRRERIPKLVLLDWIVGEAPAPFREALQGMQSPDCWQQTVEQIFAQWLHGIDNAELIRFVRDDMGSYGFEMWARAAREIGAAYDQAGSPLQALSRLDPPVPVLHLYAQPDDPAFLAAQETFGAAQPWFHVRKLGAGTHFPMFEVPDAIASAIEQFVG